MTTEREKAFGNQIFFSTNRLQYASIQDKINYVVQMGDRGRTSINEDREVFNLPPIEGGERHFIRGEYRPVDSYGEPLEPVETLDGNIAVDKSVGSGIMEERYNDGSHYTKDEHGRFTGSTGGGSSGGSSGSEGSSGNQKPKKSKPPKISQKEKSRVSHGIATDHPKLEADGMKRKYEFGNYSYDFYVQEFGSYRFVGKYKIK